MPINLQLPKKPGLLIMGTDIGVGKTFVAGTIAKLFRGLNLDTGSVFIYRVSDHAKRIVVGKDPELPEDEGYAFIV